MNPAREGRLFTTDARAESERRIAVDLAVDVDVDVDVDVTVAVADEDHSDPPFGSFGTCPPPTTPARYARALDDHDHGHDVLWPSLD